MNSKKYNVILDIYKGVLNNQLIEFTTEDYGKCVLQFELLEDKLIPYDLTGCIVRMLITGQQQDCTIIDASTGKIEIALQQSMFSVSGPIIAELQIYDELNQTLRLTTPRFRYNVRKSLMDDATAQADPAFSLLQNMILEVSNANTVANQAKATAEGALATANLAESKATQIMANGDYAKAQGDYAKAQGEKFDRVLTLDGASQTNFDFIRSKVVQDGLVSHKENQNLNGWTYLLQTQININECNFYIKSEPINIIGAGGLYILGEWSSTMTNALSIRRLGSSINIRYINISGVGAPIDNFITGLPSTTSSIDEYVYIKDNTLYVLSNGRLYSKNLPDDMSKSNLYFSHIKLYGISSGNEAIGYLNYAFIYNRPLYAYEIRDNLQVINNSQSISQITTTNADGSKSTYKLDTDSEHVIMRNGYNAEECLSGVYDMCKKEFVSTDGSAITIPNAIDKSKILNAEIKGQTIKNYVPTNGTKKRVGFTTNSKAIYLNISKVVPSKKYWISGDITNSINETTIIAVSLDGGNTRIGSVTAKNGRFNLEFTMPTSYEIKNIWFYHTLSDIDILCDINYISLTDNKITSYIPFGLSSTQAIIENNGLKYTFYTLKDGVKTPIECSGIGGIQDTFEIKEDGSGLYTDKIYYDKLFNVVSSWEKTSTIGTNTTRWYCGLTPSKLDGTIAMTSIPISNDIVNDDRVCVGTYGNVSALHIRVPNSITTSQQVNEYIKTNYPDEYIAYKLSITTATVIPKELMPIIALTNKTNICKVDSAVAPSELKIVAPVDRVAELTARLEALEAKTNTQPVNTAFVEETYAKSVNKIEEVIK